MKQTGRRGAAFGAALGLAAIAGMASSQQQEQQAGVDAFVDVRTGIRISDNPEGLEDPEGQAILSVTDLAFGIDTVTRQEQFSLRLGASYETGSYPEALDDDSGVKSPFVTLEYRRKNRDTLLSFSALLREADNGFDVFEDIDAGRDLIIDRGTRRDGRLNMGLELGRTAPIGLSLNGFYGETLYFDTTDPELADIQRAGADLEARFSLNRTTALLAFARYSESEEQDPANTVERDMTVGLGLSTRIDPALSLRIDLGFGRTETEQTLAPGNRITETEEGPVLAIGLQRTVSDGLWSADLRTDVTSVGTQTDLRFGRQRDLRNGRIAATLGVGVTSEGDVRGVGSLDWTRELRASALSVGFSQNLSSDVDDDVDTLNTSLRVGYRRALTELAGLELNLQLGAVNELVDNGTDRRRASVEVGYVQQLTEDWSFNTGYRYNLSEQTGRSDIVENQIFATIGRRFSIRP